jgi:hypothetical protein
VAAGGAQLAGWLLAAAGLVVVALNPAVPSLPFALFWLGAIAVARGIATLAPAAAVALDASLLIGCIVGVEIGGILLLPSVVSFVVADGLRDEPATAS